MSDAIKSPFSADGGRGIMLISIAGFMLPTFAYFVLTSLVNANGALEVTFALLVMALIGGLQVYYVRRIASEWATMTTGQRWKTGIVAFIVPFLAAVAVPAAIVIALLLWGLNLCYGNSGATKFSPSFGSKGSTDSPG